MKNLNYEKIKLFWENRADIFNDKSFKSTNLEEDKYLQELKIKNETKKIKKIINSIKFNNVLDLGAGLGYWSMFLSSYCNSVTAVDFSEKMINNAEMISIENGVDNICFIANNAIDFNSDDSFDLIFISGLMIYINDEDIYKLLNKIDGYSHKGSYLLLRDGTAKHKKYFINDKYSVDLKTKYSAIYRTRNQYINIFNKIGFKPIIDEDMFDKSSPLNKWDETILRLYLFKKG